MPRMYQELDFTITTSPQFLTFALLSDYLCLPNLPSTATPVVDDDEDDDDNDDDTSKNNNNEPTNLLTYQQTEQPYPTPAAAREWFFPISSFLRRIYLLSRPLLGFVGKTRTPSLRHPRHLTHYLELDLRDRRTHLPFSSAVS